MTALCSNTLAEINNDVQTNAQEQAMYDEQARYWKVCVDLLLAGQPVNNKGVKYTLLDRMANEYKEFSDFIDQDFNFMAHYIAGKFCKSVNDLFQQQARTLASIIVGE